MTREVRVELLAPAELDAALAATSVAYLPLGSLEFHGPHLPIGLDGLNAHGLCMLAAQRSGGVVLPCLYQGIGGGHTSYPWTVMMPSPDTVRLTLIETLRHLEAFGVLTAVLFTGHFASEQLAMVDDLTAEWGSDFGHTLRVVGTGVNRCTNAPLAPDHAGSFESSLLHSLSPELVHPELLPELATHPSIDPDDNQMGEQRHDPKHPLWGVFGPDPRLADLSASGALRDHLVTWLSALARTE